MSKLFGNEHYHREHHRNLLDEIRRIEKRLIWELRNLFDLFGHLAFRSRFTFIINNINFSAMDAQLKIASGSAVTGFNAPLDSAGKVLDNSAYKAGSCKYSILPNEDGSPSGGTVAAGDTEEKFVLTEMAPGSASTVTIGFDAQDINGNQLPQSKGIVTFFVPPPPPPDLAVGSQFNFDQQSSS